MKTIIDFLWLIPALPLAAAAIGALTPRAGRRLAATAALAGLGGAFVVSVLALIRALQTPGEHLVSNFIWFELGGSSVRLGWLLDPLSAFMCVMVTFVGALIFLFSLGYMKEDRNFTRFFCFLSLFASAMLGVLIANSLLLLFICWELVGLASYLLIGFWFHKPEAAAAAKKAFITTRVGDMGLFLGMLWLYRSTDTLLFFDAGRGCLEGPLAALAAQTTIFGLGVSTAIGLLLFCGAVGKSGQFPLHVWLPDAMEGPTPVSALIHAATMVAAGVFLIARVHPLMALDQGLAGAPIHALTVVAFTGALTALLGACLGVAQFDIKRVLAYSTVSQLGYMMLAIGVGSWVAAIFHLLTHAFFKALLFLCAGSVIHAAHHEQDIRRLGGLSRPMRVTFLTFAIGTMALTGIPFLFSGFWSKEAILFAAGHWSVSKVPFVLAFAAVLLTAFYMTRLTLSVFFGKRRSDAAAHAHESPAVMTVPLGILAVCAIGVGFVGTPAWPWLQANLLGVAVERGPLIESVSELFLSLLLVGSGIGAGCFLYGRATSTPESDPLARLAPRAFLFLQQRGRFDELYAATLGRGLDASVRAAVAMERHLIAGGVALVGRIAGLTGRVTRRADEVGLNAGFDAASEGLRQSGFAYSRAQTGRPQNYLRSAALAFVALVVVVVLGGGRP